MASPIHPEYLFTAPFSYQPSFPYIASQRKGSIAVECRTASNLYTVGNFYCSDNPTPPGGGHLGFCIPAYPVDPDNQSCTSSHLTPWHPVQPPNDFTRPPIYQRPCSGSQAPVVHSPFTPESPTMQQLAVKYPIEIGREPSNCFQFGYPLQVLPGDINGSNSCAMSVEIKELKRVWKEGVGIKRRQKRIEDRHYNYCIKGTAQKNAEEENIRRAWQINHPDMVQASIDEVSKQNEDNFGQKDLPKAPPSTPMDFDDLMSADQLDKLITALEEFEQIELLASPEATPTPTKLLLKNKIEDSPVTTIPSLHRPLRFSPFLKSAKARTSLLPTKEMPILKYKASSASLTKTVPSLRPPKTIARSSKPVTQPVPSNLARASVSRNLKLKKGQLYQSTR